MVAFAALSRLDGCVFCCDVACLGTPTPTPVVDDLGRRVFFSATGRVLIVVEGAPGLSGYAVATSLDPGPPDNRPDLQIQSTRPLGNGDPALPASCPPGPLTADRGVPGLEPPVFDDVPGVSEALADFACRFERGVSASVPCTQRDASGDAKTISPLASAQFCSWIREDQKFPPGESVLTVRLRDTLGNPGPTAQIVVRVATPGPGS